MASIWLAPSLSLFRKGPTIWTKHVDIVRISDYKLEQRDVKVLARKNVLQVDVEETSEGESTPTKKTSQSTKKPSKRGRKKATPEDPDLLGTVLDSDVELEDRPDTTSTEEPTKVTRRGRKKATKTSLVEKDTEKKVRRRTKKKVEILADAESEKTTEVPTREESISPSTSEEEKELIIGNDSEDISYTYAWPPLVCCCGTAQHAFIPSGRPANRMIDHEIHESMKDMFWSPKKFVRAPGGTSTGVAVALASLGGRVAFMGKLGDDEYGQSMLYHLNDNKVQTRSVKVDDTRPTTMSYMKISRRGGLKANCTKHCAEDSLLSCEINVDVLKEAKMFHFNSYALLDSNMRKTTSDAIQISKRFGGVIFFDVNLPLPLWQSRDKTISFIQEAWNHADIIEVTKQELEFICGIEPTEKFDTTDNDRSKFIHYKPEVVMPLWHDNLKVLFVTNGTSKIHYYTEKDHGCVLGMEDPPLTPFTGEMSVAGDAVVAALMKMLTVESHLITDKGYLEHTINYAINCGVTEQWQASRIRGFPPKEGMEVVKSISEREYRTVGPDDD